MEKYPIKRAYAVGKLYKFLKEKGVYKQFVKNAKSLNTMPETIKGSKNSGDLLGAFTWASTEEGYEFWRLLHEEFWKKEMNEQT